jgi:hypothetical protein
VQFRVDVNSQDNTWQVEVTSVATGEALLNAQGGSLKRTLESIGEKLSKFPQPPAKEAENIPDTAENPHRELCLTKDPQVIKKVYDKYVRREAEDVVKFGRYLFATLLGDDVWKAINDTAGNEPIELALTWKEDFAINRLPWEMMHNGKRFLAEEPEVAITRRIAGTSQTLAELTTPRVLFVIGSALNKDVIKPGAEYLALLRSLTIGARRRLKTHLLLEASPKRLKAAVEFFRPTVVHFICHGIANVQQETFLQLKSDDGNGDESVTADALLRMLRPKPGYHLPQVVILNACYTASQITDLYTKSGQAALPIAARLVAGDGEKPGVPIVVGMAGEIADQACRLFTRCFYQAILEGREVSHAAADGRRAGIIEEGLTDPKTSIDWALPTLFMSAAVDKAEIVVQPTEAEKHWYEVASEFAPSEYPGFCDRFGFFEWYDCLMVENLPAPQNYNGELQLLAVSLREKNARFDKSKLGLTWLLKQFASNAALDGHLPVLVSTVWINRDKQDYPKDYPRLVEDFKRAMTRTAQLFELKFTSTYLNLVDDLTAFSKSGKSPDEMPPQLKTAFDQMPTDLRNAFSEDKQWDGPQVQFTALRCDLLSLLELGRKKTEPEGMPNEEKKLRPKLLLLVDDVHQMDKATKTLLNQFFSSPYGLRSTAALSAGGASAKRDIRAICTYDLKMGLGEENTITTWLDTAKGVKEVPLGAFQQPEDRLAYEFFLSRWRDRNKVERPLAVSHRARADFVQSFFLSLHEEVEGIPERLKSEAATAVINAHLKMPEDMQVLRAINDEDRLRLISQLKRN